MTVAALRRLPGFAFEARVPVYDDVLPRMDVAVFVGFAANGPVNIPVPIEDPARFAEVFGVDAPLAWDSNLGQMTYAQLGPAVRMFFANGGRRCWVVRVAAAPTSNAFAVPGIVVLDTKSGTLAPLTLRARSPGSWSDDVQLSASLTSQRLGVIGWKPNELTLETPYRSPLRPGDVLQVSWPNRGVEGYVGVETVVPAKDETGRGNRQQASFSAVAWFRVPRNAEVTLPIGNADADRVQVGDVIVRTKAGKQRVLAVRKVDPADDSLANRGSPRRPRRIHGKGLVLASAPPKFSPGAPPVVRRLGIDLWARVGEGQAQRLTNIGLAPAHPRHIALLPDDKTVFETNLLGEGLDTELWRDVVSPRFPVAGDGGGNVQLCIPFGVTALPEHYLRILKPDSTALERDGLSKFSTSLFADPALAGSFSTTLLQDAEFERFLSAEAEKSGGSKRLTGLHAALSIEEATIIAVPDAMHRGWERRKETTPLQPAASPLETSRTCAGGDFSDCGAFVGAPPQFTGNEDNKRYRDGRVELEWTADPDVSDWSFVVEEASNRDWRDAVVVHTGDERQIKLVRRKPGLYYYRVRGASPRATQWSRGVVVSAPSGAEWQLAAIKGHSDSVLVDVHRLLLRFCAARRDAIAVLSLPAHYDDDAAAAHSRLLESPGYEEPAAGASTVPPLSSGEADAFGFAALYHGWVFTRDATGILRALPPDGAACGVMARRAIERGAWIAPANELLQGVLALDRPVPRSRWLDLQMLNINIMRQDPRGFVVMSADTLAPDADVRPISVRRLLILLRRVALRRGTQYVFEPNNDSFRRMVQRGFEELLGDLFQRGAFAGATSSTAFQVVTAESLNTPRSRDLGRFIVELRVAPSRPMVFLTLRLVQIGDRLNVVGA